MENVRLIALALNMSGLAVAGWAWFYPIPYVGVMTVAALLPWIAVALLVIWPHMFQLGGKEKDQHVRLFALFFIPGFALSGRVLLDTDLLDWRLPVIAGIGTGVAITAMTIVADRRTTRHIGSVCLMTLLMVPYGYGLTQFVNRVFDDAPPQFFAAEVQGKRVGTGTITTYHVELSAWGPYEGPNEVIVSQADYDQLGTRNTVCIRINHGALGMPYQSLVAPVQCAADPEGAAKHVDRSPASPPLDGQPIGVSAVGAGVAAYHRGDYAAALKLLAEPAAAGKPEAQFTLGLLHWEGQGTPRNLDQAMTLFQRAAAQGHARAMNVIGYSHHHGIGLPVDAKEAVTWYRKAVALGEPRAINNLAILYREGRGVPLDMSKADALWRRAAEQDHAPAMNNLGIMYATGQGVSKDMDRAMYWWRRSARVGDHNGAWMLARHLLSGPDSAQALDEAVQMARQAADAGVADAAYVMSLLYREGRGVPPSKKEQMKWLSHAARLGHPIAAVENGIIYNAVKKHGEAVRMFRLAVERGYARGQALLGQHYESGLGIRRNLKKAITLYRLAADRGDALGQRQLGYAYDLGRGIERDRTEAARFYRLAAAQGDAYAAYNLSILLQGGRGLPQDVFESFKWARVAAERGHSTALNNVAYSYARGVGVTRDILKAIAYYHRAALYGQPNALHSLAAHYYAGQGVQRDVGKAYYWLLLAERFYATSEDRARLAPLRQQIQGSLVKGKIDVSAIEKNASAFVQKAEPVFPLPPAGPYRPARRG